MYIIIYIMIGQVWKQKKNDVKLVTIPKKSDIEEGDYVEFHKVEENERKQKD